MLLVMLAGAGSLAMLTIFATVATDIRRLVRAVLAHMIRVTANAAHHGGSIGAFTPDVASLAASIASDGGLVRAVGLHVAMNRLVSKVKVI